MKVHLGERVDPALLGELPEEIELVDDAGQAEVVVEPKGELLRRLRTLPHLRAVLVGSAGTDWLEPHLPEGVTLANARGARDAAVAEWAVAAILAMEKRLFDQRDAQGRGEWWQFSPPDVEGRSALILGHGSIGAAIEARLAPFGVDVVRVARRAREGVHPVDALDRLLGAAQILVVVAPLTEATRGLVDAQALALLPDGALVVNVGRGAVVDTGALVAELRDGRLRAALDVVDPEPLPPDHPLWTTPGTFLSAHVSGDSRRADEAALRLIGEQLRRLAWGAPLLNVVR